MKLYAAVVFDFDGTLVESATLKRGGYRAALDAVGMTDSPEAWYAYDRHRFSNRRILLALCFAELAGVEPTADQMELLYHGYTAHIRSHPEDVRVFPGLDRFFARSRGLPLYVSSNAPIDETNTTCERLGIRKFFVEVYGHPMSKEDAIRQIASRAGTDVSGVVYVGDHPGDEQLARRVGAEFVHLDPPGEFLEKVSGPSLRSLDELGDVLFGGDG